MTSKYVSMLKQSSWESREGFEQRVIQQSEHLDSSTRLYSCYDTADEIWWKIFLVMPFYNCSVSLKDNCPVRSSKTLMHQCVRQNYIYSEWSQHVLLCVFNSCYVLFFFFFFKPVISSKTSDDPTFKKNHEAWKFFEGKTHLTATYKMLVWPNSTVQLKRPPTGPVLHVPVQTQALPQKASHKLQWVLAKREWKSSAPLSYMFVMVNGRVACTWLIMQCKCKPSSRRVLSMRYQALCTPPSLWNCSQTMLCTEGAA